MREAGFCNNGLSSFFRGRSAHCANWAARAIKADNGSAFRAEATGRWMAGAGAQPHFSPPGYPQYNTISRPWGHTGPTPQEACDARTPVTARERETFARQLDQQRHQVRADSGVEGQQLPAAQADELERQAVACTLDELGYVTRRK